MTVTIGAAAVVVILFSGDVLTLWLQDPVLLTRLVPLVSVLALGSLLNGLMWIPSSLQLACGWVGLTVRAIFVSVALLIPLLLIVTPRYGALGTAVVWVLLNLGSFTITAHVMFGRLLSSERLRYYLVDIAGPLLSATIVASSVKFVVPSDGSTWIRIAVLTLASSGALVAAALAAPVVRAELATGLVALRHLAETPGGNGSKQADGLRHGSPKVRIDGGGSQDVLDIGIAEISRMMTSAPTSTSNDYNRSVAECGRSAS